MGDKIRINSNYMNDRIDSTATYAKNDIYRKFNKQFDKLFDANEQISTLEELREIYVSDESFEADIDDFRRSLSSSTKYCVGYTGIGKSTSIRFCFNLTPNDYRAKLDHSRHEVLLPVMLDAFKRTSSANSASIKLTERISATCTYLLEQFPKTKDYLKTIAGKESLYDFILRHTPDALENVNYEDDSSYDAIDLLDMDKNEEIKVKLRFARKKNPYQYFANFLKFIIKLNYEMIHNLIIILDDIESFPDDVQLEIINDFLKFKECMENTDFPVAHSAHRYYIKLLISLRPDTFRRLQLNRRIETFSKNNPVIPKKNAVELSAFFKKRFDYYTKVYANEIGNLNTWTDCYNELVALNNKFNGKYKEMIQKLCFFDIRKSLACYSDIFSNRFYIQANKKREDIFTVSQDEYNFDNITVIRAISCHENLVYFGDDSASYIPNFFFTTIDDDFSIECLLVMQYFSHQPFSGAYGINAQQFEVTYANWLSVFGIDFTLRLRKALDYLFVKKIIRKSIKDSDDLKTRDTPDAINNDTHLYLSPLGDEVFKMLTRDSVTLELLREAAWRDYSRRAYNDEPSSALIYATPKRRSRQYIIFNDLLEYISYLSEIEASVISIVHHNKTMSKYLSFFGFETVSTKLLTGVRRSIEYSGVMHEHPEVRRNYEQTHNQIVSLTGRLKA